ncbi:MAG: hypothetical protein GXO07_02810 [Crenarchaeota archaeon]|nr:hypothetical protein [Thermoproteota archaeon]
MLQVVGPRKSGKTALVVELVKELRSLGIEPKVVKQTKHSLLDTDFGDTRRVAAAGAGEVVLLCRDGVRYQRRGRVSLEEVVEEMEGVIIVEGGKGVKRRDWMAVVTWRNEVERRLYWKPLTVAEMGPGDSAPLLAWRLARILAAAARAQSL